MADPALWGFGGVVAGGLISQVFGAWRDRLTDKRTNVRALAVRSAEHLAELERAVGTLEQWRDRVESNTRALEDHRQAIEALQAGLVALRERIASAARTNDVEQLGRTVAELKGLVDGALAVLRRGGP